MLRTTSCPGSALKYKVTKRQRQDGEKKFVYVSELRLKDLNYMDTGTFTCTYNGTSDLASIDNSTKVHLYVDDGQHLLKDAGFNFFMVVQSQTFTLPCMPTHPDVNVTLWRGGGSGLKRVFADKYISFDPKVMLRNFRASFKLS